MPHNDASTNYQRLLAAEIIASEDLPTPYARVVEGLTDDEVDVLIAVKSRLLAADEWAGVDPPEAGELPHAMGIVQF